MRSNLITRFLKYVSFDTQSDPKSNETPSTFKQWDIAKYLYQELKDLGLCDVTLDEKGYLFATLPSNSKKEIPTIGFIAHYDTSPDCSGEGVTPRIVENYDGKPITLNEEEQIILSPSRFPELLNHLGKSLIVTNGKTLLGADDKAGIAEIITAVDYLLQHPEIEHGTIRIGFNPDEEIGRGAHHFDVQKFNCDWAYTMDGSSLGELEYENFNAAVAQIEITGLSVHPGYAKNKMINAIRIAAELASLFPKEETPERTQGYEGFYHILSIEGNVEKANITLIIRDHDSQLFIQRKDYVKELVKQMQQAYGKETIALRLEDQYYNMKEKVEPVHHIIDLAIDAMKQASIEPKIKAIRGGTDGAQLSFKGLPCPNIFAGGENFHGPYEFVPIEVMEKAVETILNICTLTAQKVK